MPYLSALEVSSRRGPIQIHFYVYLTLPLVLFIREGVFICSLWSSPEVDELFDYLYMHCLSLMQINDDNIHVTFVKVTVLYGSFLFSLENQF